MTKIPTTYKKFQGVIGWNHLVEPDDYLGDKKYVLDFYPDDYAEVKATGSRLKLDRGTGSYIRPRRDYEKDFGDGVTKLEPPKVWMPDGSDFEGKYIPKGSRVEVNVAIYDGGRFGKGTRLQSVKILELAEEEAKEEKTEEVAEVEAEVEATLVAAKKGSKPKLPF